METIRQTLYAIFDRLLHSNGNSALEDVAVLTRQIKTILATTEITLDHKLLALITVAIQAIEDRR